MDVAWAVEAVSVSIFEPALASLFLVELRSTVIASDASDVFALLVIVQRLWLSAHTCLSVSIGSDLAQSDLLTLLAPNEPVAG
jgi:hypothetical protein